MTQPSTLITCTYCSQPRSIMSNECCHCEKLFCYECLIKHHHTDVRYEFTDMINQINALLAPFLHHAHNQTEWTDHLTEDRTRLENNVKYIESSYQHCPVYALPNAAWISHVKNLIKKQSFAMYEDCYLILYPHMKPSVKL